MFFRLGWTFIYSLMPIMYGIPDLLSQFFGNDNTVSFKEQSIHVCDVISNIVIWFYMDFDTVIFRPYILCIFRQKLQCFTINCGLAISDEFIVTYGHFCFDQVNIDLHVFSGNLRLTFIEVGS